MEDLRVLVTDDGKTLIDDEGSLIRCATHWRDDKYFYQNLTARLAYAAVSLSFAFVLCALNSSIRALERPKALVLWLQNLLA